MVIKGEQPETHYQGRKGPQKHAAVTRSHLRKRPIGRFRSERNDNSGDLNRNLMTAYNTIYLRKLAKD